MAKVNSDKIKIRSAIVFLTHFFPCFSGAIYVMQECLIFAVSDPFKLYCLLSEHETIEILD